MFLALNYWQITKCDVSIELYAHSVRNCGGLGKAAAFPSFRLIAFSSVLPCVFEAELELIRVDLNTHLLCLVWQVSVWMVLIREGGIYHQFNSLLFLPFPLAMLLIKDLHFCVTTIIVLLCSVTNTNIGQLDLQSMSLHKTYA